MVDVLLGLKNRIPKEKDCIGNKLDYVYIKNKISNLLPGDIYIVHGPPGCGKTFMIENAINGCKKNMVKLKSTENENKSI